MVKLGPHSRLRSFTVRPAPLSTLMRFLCKLVAGICTWKDPQEKVQQGKRRNRIAGRRTRGFVAFDGNQCCQGLALCKSVSYNWSGDLLFREQDALLWSLADKNLKTDSLWSDSPPGWDAQLLAASFAFLKRKIESVALAYNPTILLKKNNKEKKEDLPWHYHIKKLPFYIQSSSKFGVDMNETFWQRCYGPLSEERRGDGEVEDRAGEKRTEGRVRVSALEKKRKSRERCKRRHGRGRVTHLFHTKRWLCDVWKE